VSDKPGPCPVCGEDVWNHRMPTPAIFCDPKDGGCGFMAFWSLDERDKNRLRTLQRHATENPALKEALNEATHQLQAWYESHGDLMSHDAEDRYKQMLDRFRALTGDQ